MFSKFIDNEYNSEIVLHAFLKKYWFVSCAYNYYKKKITENEMVLVNYTPILPLEAILRTSSVDLFIPFNIFEQTRGKILFQKKTI